MVCSFRGLSHPSPWSSFPSTVVLSPPSSTTLEAFEFLDLKVSSLDAFDYLGLSSHTPDSHLARNLRQFELSLIVSGLFLESQALFDTQNGPILES